MASILAESDFREFLWEEMAFPGNFLLFHLKTKLVWAELMSTVWNKKWICSRFMFFHLFVIMPLQQKFVDMFSGQ